MKKVLSIIAIAFSFFGATATPVFIENVGQFTNQFHQSTQNIDFGLRTPGMNIFIEAGGIHYQFMKAETQETPKKTFDPFLGRMIGGLDLLKIHRVDVELLGANKNVQPVKKGRLQYYERYYTPQFGEQGGAANAYSKIIYKDIYPFIDWVLYINGDQLEYDFIIHEGGNPADIKMRYNGINSLKLDSKGNLISTTSLGNITEHKPITWQEDGKQIATSFTVNDNTVSFKVAPYKGTLLIDPYMEWATYFGGADHDGSSGVAEDASGNIYISSFTFSAANIATTGAYDVSYADSGDVYFAKFDSAGTLLWATYYGSSATDIGSGPVYDYHGCFYLVGTTNSSTSIATIGSDQPTFSGPYVPEFFPQYAGDVFLVKFDTNGNRIWGTYFGGDEKELPAGVTCDTAGNVYMSGTTYSTTNIATSGAHQLNKAGSWDKTDGFLVKYNAAGQKLWATYYGGDLNDHCYGLTVFQENKIFFCGNTRSSNNMSTLGTYQNTLPSNQSGFIACFDNNGSRLWGTYFGGNTFSANTNLYSISCNANGDIFVSGQTNDQSGMTTTGSHQPSYGGDGGPYITGDAVIAKFDNTGNRIWSTYLGGSGGEQTGIKCSSISELYIIGATSSPNNIAFNAFQGTYMGGAQAETDGLLAKFTDAGNCLWSTYLGGTGDDWLGDIKVSTDDYIYISGAGTSLPTTPDSHQPSFGGGEYDTYLAKFKDFPTGITCPPSIKENIHLSPNPNNGTFTIEGKLRVSSENISLTITNISGQQVHSEQFQSTGQRFSKTIQLNNTLPRGLYIVTIISGNYSATERIVIN